MARIDTLSNFLTDVAEAIRAKKGTTETIAASDFDTEIESIESGGDSELETSFMSMIDDSRGSNITVLPHGLTTIGPHAFYSRTNLVSLSLPDSLIKIGNSAFHGCTNLSLEELPDSVTTLDSYAFNNCTNLALKKLPKNLTAICTYTFGSCSSLALSELPNTIERIDTDGLYKCSNITLSKLPDALTSMGAQALQGCSSITVSSLPAGITSVSNNCFAECTSLTKMTLHSGVRSTGTYSFGSSGLQQLICEGDTSIGTKSFTACASFERLVFKNLTRIPSLSNVNAFEGTLIASGTGYIYVPDDRVESFKTAPNWSVYANQIKPLSELPEEVSE